MIKIELLRTFATVARTGSLAAAAEQLARTQSAVSMALKQLEDHLGERLFESDRKNRLTPLGVQILDMAQPQLRAYDETVRSIEAAASAPDGLIRMAAVPSVASLVFPQVVDKFAEANPKINLELRDADTGAVMDALTRGEIDIGIASAEPNHAGVDATPLFADPFGLICAPSHPLAEARAALTTTDVFGASYVQNELSCALLGQAGIVSDTRLSALNTLSLIALVRMGRMVTILPRSVVAIAPQDVVFRPLSDIIEMRQVYVFQRARAPFQHLSQIMVDMICDIDWNWHLGGVVAD